MVPENTFIHRTQRTMVSVGMMLRFFVSQFDFSFKSFSAHILRNQGTYTKLNNFWNKTNADPFPHFNNVCSLRECSSD